MRRSNFILFLLLFLCNDCFSQDLQTNLQKYWRFRERLKNFVVTGDCFGCGLPAKDRDFAKKKIEWSDATIHLGYYIGMLATEHAILAKNNLYDKLKQNERELFYAIETINRLDRWAEFRWEEYELGINHNGATPPMSHLNGFFIRDDIPKDETFFQQSMNGKNVRELLNSSSFPLPDGYNLLKSVSGYTVGIDEGYGPREQTIDQVIQLYIGLALVARLIGTQVIYINEETQTPMQFMDGQSSFLQEVKNISNRITGRIQNDNWLVVNPVMPGCSQGVCGNRSCVLGACGGGNATGLCYGFYKANCFIQQGGGGCSADGQTDGNSVLWATTYRWNALADQDFKVLTLAAIGRTWDARTDNILVERCLNAGAEHLPLLYNVLYDEGALMLPDMYYVKMLDEVWCTGNNGYEGPVQWRGQSRVLYGPNRDPVLYGTHYSNIDYMLYLNLYILSHPDYAAANYHYYSPDELCDAAIEKKNIVMNEQRQMQAVNAISLVEYKLENSAISNASLLLSAGKEITLKETTVMPGAKLTAEIKPGLKEYICRNELQSSDQKNLASPSLLVIPNPNDGNFFILTDHFYGSYYRLIISNSMGQTVLIRDGIAEGLIQVSLKDANGLYIASLVSNRIVASQKIVITANRVE